MKTSFSFPVKHKSPPPGTVMRFAHTANSVFFPEDGLGDFDNRPEWKNDEFVIEKVYSQDARILPSNANSARRDLIIVNRRSDGMRLSYYYSLGRFAPIERPNPQTVVSTFPLSPHEKDIVDNISAVLGRDVYIFDFEYKRGVQATRVVPDNTAIVICVRSQCNSSLDTAIVPSHVGTLSFLGRTYRIERCASSFTSQNNELHIPFSLFDHHSEKKNKHGRLDFLQKMFNVAFGTVTTFQYAKQDHAGVSIDDLTAHLNAEVTRAKAVLEDEKNRILNDIAEHERYQLERFQRYNAILLTEVKSLDMEKIKKSILSAVKNPLIKSCPSLDIGDIKEDSAPTKSHDTYNPNIGNEVTPSSLVLITKPLFLQLDGGDIPVGPLKITFRYMNEMPTIRYLWADDRNITFLHVSSGVACFGGWGEKIKRALATGDIESVLNIILEWASQFNPSSRFMNISPSLSQQNVIVEELVCLKKPSSSDDDEEEIIELEE